MTMTKAELEVEHAALLAEHAALKDKHEKQTESLFDIAGEAAYQEELCTVLEKTFTKAGLPTPEYRVQVERTTVETYDLSGFDYYRLGLHIKRNRTEAHLRDAIVDTAYVYPKGHKQKTLKPVITVERKA